MAARKKNTQDKRGGSASVGEGPMESATPSATAVAAEAMRTGVVPLKAAQRTDEGNRGDTRLKAGDRDTSAMGNATVGDEAPGGTVTTPDQDRVDDIEDFHCPEVEWDWDDGGRSVHQADCAPLESGADIERRFTAHHAYAKAGTYNVKMTMRRADRSLAVATTLVTVRPGLGDMTRSVD